MTLTINVSKQCFPVWIILHYTYWHNVAVQFRKCHIVTALKNQFKWSFNLFLSSIYCLYSQSRSIYSFLTEKKQLGQITENIALFGLIKCGFFLCLKTFTTHVKHSSIGLVHSAHTHPCSSLTDIEILRLCPRTWRAVRMSAHWTISPRGPPFRTLGLKTSPDSSVRKPTWTRIWRRTGTHCGRVILRGEALQQSWSNNLYKRI